MSFPGRILRGALSNLIWVVPTYFLAPDLYRRDPLTWIYLGVVLTATSVGAALVDPVSINDRSGEDKKSEVWLSLGLLGGLLLAAACAGRGWVWSPPLRPWGLGALTLGFGLRIAAVTTNRWFSGTLLVQKERGHQVVRHGPYRWVRHPGYAALLLILPGHALAWGAPLALLPLLGATAVVLRRTHLEDKFLAANLTGYDEYQREVKYRLVPGIY